MVSKEYGQYLLKKIQQMDTGLKVKENNILYEDYQEVTYIYKDENTMLKHKDLMESVGYKVYQYGDQTWFRGDEVINPNSMWSKYDVKIPTAIYGININGLLAEAREFYNS